MTRTGSRRLGPFGLPRNVFLLGWTSFFTDMGSEMILPVLPLYLRGALATPMVVIGMIEGAAEATANLMRLGSGFLADRMGRAKPFVYAGYGLSSAAKPLMALATSWPLVLAIRFVERVGKGVRNAPRDVLLAAASPARSVGRTFGFHRAMDNAGAIAGSGIAAAVLWWAGAAAPGVMRWLFAASAVPSAVAIAFIVPVRDAAPPAGRHGRPAGQAPRRAPSLVPLLAGIALWELGNLSYAFMLLRLEDLGLPARAVPLAYLVFNVIAMAASIPAGLLTDVLGVRRALLVAPAAGAAALWLLGADGGWGIASAGVAAFAVHHAIVNTVPRAAITRYAAAGRRGTMFGLIGVCAFAGNGAAGWLWQAFGASRAMRVAGALSLASLVPFAILPAPRRAS